MWLILGVLLYVFGVVGAVNLASEDGDLTQEEAVAMGILWPVMLPFFGAIQLLGWDE